eukprot:COSAG02_NODE_1861_length_10613_cov_3.797033_10_plen_86_part_00
MKITTPQRPSTVGYVRDLLPGAADKNADALGSGTSSVTGTVDTKPTSASTISASTASSKESRSGGDSGPSGQQGLSSLPKGIGAY